ncbi:MAG: phosphoadenylyl-sulfate reductase, partial [Gammaproteobacteria bacterium]
MINKNIENLAVHYEHKSPQEILAYALTAYEHIAISFSGAEDVVLVDMATKIRNDVRIFSLDTGRLHAETYRFLERVRDRYQIRIEVLFPDPLAVERLVREKGLFSFYKDGHKECCAIRKVGPLRRKLQSLDAWITGQRKDQSPGTRIELAVIEKDAAFSTKERSLIKFNPLSNWSSAEVWRYIQTHDVP